MIDNSSIKPYTKTNNELTPITPKRDMRDKTFTPFTPNTPYTFNFCVEGFEVERKRILDNLRQKQLFRVATGKSKWIDYETSKFSEKYNLREILDDEIVIEFDMPKDWNKTLKDFQNEISWPGINATAINLYKAGIVFEIWDHEGKSPHIHIHDLPIKHLDKEKRKTFKKIFIRKYVPSEFLAYADTSLCGIHLVALEWANHWKGKYGIKRLLNKFNPDENDRQ